MRLRTFLAVAILAVLPLSQAMAQADSTRADKAPSDLMVAMQFQHIKLWFAGRLSNWPLASYELSQLEAGLQRAANPGDQRIDQAASQVRALRSAIDAKDVAAFTKAYGELTNGCNACHRAEGKGFVTVQVPANSPFTDQLFVDQVAEGRALAHAICGNCHVVSDGASDKPDLRIPAPSFPALVSGPGFSADHIRELLTSGHRYLGPNQGMPNPRLASYQIEEIIAFFETLRAERAR
jgi:mono/diheme cytochrome c family protein